MLRKYELHDQCEYPTENSIDIIKECLSQGFDVNLMDDYGYTPLDYAVRSQNEDMVEFLLKNKADPSQVSPHIYSPLVVAASKNLYRSVNALLEHPSVSVDEYHKGVTALYVAAQNGHEEIVDLLLAKNTNPFMCHRDNNASPLVIAATKGHASIINKLCKIAPSLIHLTTKEGATPLHAAAEGNFTLATECLIKNGANLNAVCHENLTPLVRAIRQGHTEIVSLLLKHNADYIRERGTVKRNKALITPLTFAILYKHIPIIKQLLQYPHTVEMIKTSLHQVMFSYYESHNNDDRKIAYEMSEILKEELDKTPSMKVLTLQNVLNLSWEKSYEILFNQTANEHDKTPKTELTAIRYALASIYQLLFTPQAVIPYLTFLSEQISLNWKRQYGEDFPSFDSNLINFWDHEGMLWPLPNENYKSIKKNNLLERIIQDKFKQYEMGNLAFKWTGFIPEPEASKLLHENVIFGENRKTINGLLHGNMHNIQRFIILCAMEEEKIPLSYKTKEGNIEHIKPKQLFSALVRKDLLPSGMVHYPLWQNILDYDHYDWISFTHPHRLQSVLLTDSAFSGPLQDYLRFSFCNEFIKLRNLHNHVYETNYTNEELCHEIKKIPSGIFGILPEFTIQWDERKELKKVMNINQFEGKGRFWNIQPKQYPALDEPVVSYANKLNRL